MTLDRGYWDRKTADGQKEQEWKSEGELAAGQSASRIPRILALANYRGPQKDPRPHDDSSSSSTITGNSGGSENTDRLVGRPAS